jgi:hypothetical protein
MKPLRVTRVWVTSILTVGLALACEVAPPPTVLTPDECEDAGGRIIGDPGDGSSYENGCPGGGRLLGNVALGIEGGICCGPPRLITLDECAAQGGIAIADPGDGSTHRDGCPDGGELLGSLGIELGDEGGICCRSE